ncbi:MAG: NAD(P)-dependent oxidoreductase [Candidatus Omnitrophica bacterium]|nr:NAD(P)-dependent oxidoreductase [Candidatus Omnitrophota bacterium]
MKPRIRPRVQPPPARRRNFDEVVQGYTAEEALAEAQRCILCRNARCQTACPLTNQIPRWIAELQQGRPQEAYRILRETSPMPELCSRLCPQERLCEGSCAIGIKHEPVAIGLLERFVSDQGRAAAAGENGATSPSKRVAAVGSGPASLALAQCLARAGQAVTVFERWPHPGGVLRWIPRFKLPREILEAHLDGLTALGVAFREKTEIREVQQLLTGEGFDAVFLGIGASRPSVPNLPGVSLEGILSSTEFLVRSCWGGPDLPNGWQPITDLAGRRVVVLGGGDSAMDCVRTAIRLGGAQVTCLYRRDEANMPGSRKEVKAAREEGAEFQFLASPAAFHSADGRSVSRVECLRMELGAPDASGRRSPQPVAGSAFETEAELVVLAFGYEVETGAVKINPATGATREQGVFAGGDCVTGPSLVSTAARAGLTAARGMLRYFAGEPWDALAG